MPNAAGEATDVALGPVARISKFFAGVFSHRAAVDAAEDVFKKGAKASKADPKLGDVDGILNGTKSAKVEPTVGPAKPKAAEDAAAPTKKAHSGANQDDISEQLKQAKDTGKTAAEREAEAAAQKAAAEEAAAKAKAAGGAEDAAKAGAKTASGDEALGKLSNWDALRMRSDLPFLRRGNMTLTQKLNRLEAAGRPEDAESLLAKWRVKGKITGRDASEIEKTNLPQNIKDIAMKAADKKDSLLGMGSPKEWVSSHIYNFKHNTLGAFLRLPYDAVSLSLKPVTTQLRIAKAIFKNKWRTAGIAIVAAPVAVGLDKATDGASTELAAGATKGMWHLDKAYVGTLGGLALSTLGLGLDLIGKDTTKKLAAGAADAAETTVTHAPNVFGRFLQGVTGYSAQDVMQFKHEHPLLSAVMPDSAKSLFLASSITVATDKDGKQESPAGTSGKPNTVATVKGLEGRAKAAVGGVIDKGEEAGGLGALLSGIDITDPDKSWKKMELAAKGNPMMEKIMQAADKNPLMKWGVILGFGAGILGGGKPGERLMAGIKNAIVIGLMMDLVGGLFGYHSILGDKFNSMLHGGSRAPAGNNDLGLNYHPGADGSSPGQTVGDTSALSAERLEAAKRYIALEDPDHKMFKSQAEIDAAVDKQAARFNAMPAAQFQQVEADMKNRVITSGVGQQPLPNATNAGVFQTVQDGSRGSVARALDGTPQQDDTKESFNGGATQQATTAPLLSADNPVAVNYPVYNYGGDNKPTYGSFDYGSDTGGTFGTGLNNKNVPVPMPSMG